MTIAREEIFGPVLCVITYDTDEEAIRIANDSKYGLHAAVIGTELRRARRIASELRAGRVVINGDRGTGEAYCLAHHVTVKGENRRLMLASLRYNDTFVKRDGVWSFAERLLYVDWVDERALS
jgi:hypothetical protein